MARQQHLGQGPGERLDTEEINIGNKTMQQEVSLSIDMFFEKVNVQRPTILEQVFFLFFFLMLLTVYLAFLMFCIRKIRASDPLRLDRASDLVDYYSGLAAAGSQQPIPRPEELLTPVTAPVTRCHAMMSRSPSPGPHYGTCVRQVDSREVSTTALIIPCSKQEDGRLQQTLC